MICAASLRSIQILSTPFDGVISISNNWVPSQSDHRVTEFSSRFSSDVKHPSGWVISATWVPLCRLWMMEYFVQLIIHWLIFLALVFTRYLWYLEYITFCLHYIIRYTQYIFVYQKGISYKFYTLIPLVIKPIPVSMFPLVSLYFL